jgi:MoaA/NifB/PqqE/SkfB family radical SAM enzyme
MFLKQIAHKAWKAIPHIPWAAKHAWHVFQRRGYRRGMNYIQTLVRTAEDGAGFDWPLYTILPARRALYPHRIEVEVTTKCSLKCVKCEQTYWSETQQNMSYEQFVHVLNQFPRLTTVSMSGIGHNFQNPDFLPMVEYACSRQLFVQFFDTFLLLNENRARKLVEFGVSKINLSIDGATKDVYESCQVGSNFELIVANARRLAQIKKEMRSLQPEMAFTVVVTNLNQHQLPEFLEIIASIVGDSQKYAYVEFIRLLPFKENRYLMPDVTELPAAQDAVLRRAAQMNTPFRFRFAFNHFHEVVDKPPVNCCLEWIVPFITVHGTVYPCCALTEGNQRSKIEKYCMGNIFETPFRELWKGPKYSNLRSMLRRNEAPPVCNIFRECNAFATETAFYKHKTVREEKA